MRHLPAMILGVGLVVAPCMSAQALELKDQKDKESYSLGFQFGQSLKAQALSVDLDVYTSGLKDALSGIKPSLSPEEIQATVTELQRRVMAERQKALQEKAEKGLAESRSFMEENKKKEGVRTLSNGVQYKVLKQGSGKIPKATDEVTLNLSGTLVDGTEIESTSKSGTPLTVKVNQISFGWGEALKSMEEGSRWQVFVPPELAYGARDMGRVPPGSVLVFDVELLAVK